jgi:hypothetical protein
MPTARGASWTAWAWPNLGLRAANMLALASLALLILVGVLAAAVAERVNRAADWVAHSLEVQARTEGPSRRGRPGRRGRRRRARFNRRSAGRSRLFGPRRTQPHESAGAASRKQTDRHPIHRCRYSPGNERANTLPGGGRPAPDLLCSYNRLRTKRHYSRRAA